MKEEVWRLLATLAAVAAGAVAVVVAAVAAGAVAVVVAAVAVVVAAVAAGDNPKLSICISCAIIAFSIISLFYTLPVAMNPPQTILVICQTTQTHTGIFIHNSMTETITKIATSNSTFTQIASKVSCP